jgi:hypothetical protein
VLMAPVRLIFKVLRGFLEHPVPTIVFVVALFAGVAVSDSWIGHLVGNLVNIGPWYTPHVLFGLAVFVIGCDLFRDSIAERFAIYLALIMPSLAMAIPKTAKLHTLLAGWITDLNDWATRVIGPWITNTSKGNVVLTGIGFIGIAIAITWCERYAKKSGGGGLDAPASVSGASPAPATATPTPVRRRR